MIIKNAKLLFSKYFLIFCFLLIIFNIGCKQNSDIEKNNREFVDNFNIIELIETKNSSSEIIKVLKERKNQDYTAKNASIILSYMTNTKNKVKYNIAYDLLAIFSMQIKGWDSLICSQLFDYYKTKKMNFDQFCGIVILSPKYLSFKLHHEDYNIITGEFYSYMANKKMEEYYTHNLTNYYLAVFCILKCHPTNQSILKEFLKGVTLSKDSPKSFKEAAKEQLELLK